MKLYVAGPMTGLPEFNFPEFHRVAAELRAAGYEVLSPAEYGETAAEQSSKPWTHWMRKGLQALLECEGVATLNGWQRSQGASLEIRVATTLDMPIKNYSYWLADRERP